jgi:hypothetical protein
VNTAIPFLFPAIGILLTLVVFAYRRTSIANLETQYANYRAGELARRLGLRLVEGDPQFNLCAFDVPGKVRYGFTTTRTIDVRIRMQGEPHGVPLELIYSLQQESKSIYRTTTVTTHFDCRMTAYARQTFPPFEVLSRKAPVGSIEQAHPIAPLPTGNPAVDETYLVATAEPAMARLLGQSMGGFADFASGGVHLWGDGRGVSFVMKKDRSPVVMSALYYAESMSKLLCDLARRVGG